MATVSVTQEHSMGAGPAKAALGDFESDMAKFGMKAVWSGNQAKMKGKGASGEIRVTDSQVTVTVKLGMLAKVAGVDSARLQQSIEKRLRAAVGQ